MEQNEPFIWSISLGIPLFVTAILLFYPMIVAFTVTDEATGSTVYSVPIRAEQPFIIQYIHSVHLTPVVEYYRVRRNHDIVLEKVVYESYGVGNPSGPGPKEQFRIENGTFILEGIDRKLQSIPLRIGQIKANHQLTVDETVKPFSSWSEPGSLVKIEVKKVSPITLWRGDWIAK